MNTYTELDALYRRSDKDVRARKLNPGSAQGLYGDYVEFVHTVSPVTGSLLLDLGCGNGWSSYLLGQLGYRVTGADLNAAFFEPPVSANLSFQEASVLDLPFDDDSFDIVAANQMLEHVPAPERALSAMLRVVKPGGFICIVGPNLISPLQSLRGVFRHVWKNRPIQRIFVRQPGMPRHPCGNTLPEALNSLWRNAHRVTSRILSPSPHFELREPDLIPPFHSDNDACYLCNPLDLTRFFRSQSCKVVRDGKYGRPAFTRCVVSGTWIAVQKALPVR